jgi:hypothetical protein
MRLIDSILNKPSFHNGITILSKSFCASIIEQIRDACIVSCVEDIGSKVLTASESARSYRMRWFCLLFLAVTNTPAQFSRAVCPSQSLLQLWQLVNSESNVIPLGN